MRHEYSCFWLRRRWKESWKRASPLSPSLPLSSHLPSSISTHYARSTPSDAHIFPHSGFHKIAQKRFRGTIFLKMGSGAAGELALFFKGPCSTRRRRHRLFTLAPISPSHSALLRRDPVRETGGTDEHYKTLPFSTPKWEFTYEFNYIFFFIHFITYCYL